MSLILDALKRSESERAKRWDSVPSAHATHAQRRSMFAPLLALGIALLGFALIAVYLYRTGTIGSTGEPASVPDVVADSTTNADSEPQSGSTESERMPVVVQTDRELNVDSVGNEQSADPVDSAAVSSEQVDPSALRPSERIITPIPPQTNPAKIEPEPTAAVDNMPAERQPEPEPQTEDSPVVSVASPPPVPVASVDLTPPARSDPPRAQRPRSSDPMPTQLIRELSAINISMQVWSKEPEKRFVIVGESRLIEGDELIPGVSIVEIHPKGLTVRDGSTGDRWPWQR